MYRNIDVMTEVRKIASSKPVHAAAGAGVAATQTLRDLPGRIVRLGLDGTTIVTTLPSRATEYVMTARSKAVAGYDTLASKGKKVIDGRGGSGSGSLNGKPASHGTGSTGSTGSTGGSRGSGASSRSKSK